MLAFKIRNHIKGQNVSIKKWYGNTVTASERLRGKMSFKSNNLQREKKEKKGSINTSELSGKQREAQIHYFIREETNNR